MVDGLQVPEIPLGEVVLNWGGVVPEQIVTAVSKLGVTVSVTVIVT